MMNLQIAKIRTNNLKAFKIIGKNYDHLKKVTTDQILVTKKIRVKNQI